jgi:predicted transposase YbfD/YdcC
VANVQVRYYLSSLPADAARIAWVDRRHWEIENRVHWVLDVAFREDRSLTVGIKAKRLRCGWNHDYLLQVPDS